MIGENSSLPKLPKSWVWTRLGEISEINPKFNDDRIPDDVDVTFLPMRCVEELTGYIDLSLVKRLSKVRKGYTPFIDGDLLFAKITPCMENGKVAIVYGLKNGIGFGSTEFHVIRLFDLLPRKFFFFFLIREELRKDARRNMTGSAGQLRVPANYMKQIPISLPPLSEQCRIVAKIEELFTKLGAGLEALKRVKVQLRRYRQAVSKYAFEGKLTEKWREIYRDELEPASVLLDRICTERKKQLGKKYKEPKPIDISSLPELPEGWEWARIKDVCDLINGRAFKPTEWSRQGLPIIRIQNLNNPNASFNYCNFKVDDKFLVNNEQLLFAWSGTPRTSFGAHIWNRGKAILNQHIFKVDIDENLICKNFLMYLMNYNIGEYIRKAHGTAGLAHITKNRFENSLISIPSFLEQVEIAEKIKELIVRANAVEKTIRVVEARCEKLAQSILAKAFRGELVEKDPSDEPAEKLLKRIKADKTKREAEARSKNRRRRNIELKQGRLI